MGNSTTPLSTALTMVRNFLDEPNPAMWTNAQLTAYLNTGQADVQRTAEVLRQWTTIPAIVGTQRYNAPADLLRVYRLEYIPTNSPQVYTLDFYGFNEMDQWWGNWQTNTAGAWPNLYTMWMNPPQLQLIVYPIPANTGVFNCYYYRQPVPMVATTDTMDCGEGYEDIIYDYAVYRALRQDADPRWQDQYQLYKDNLQMMIDHTRSFTDQANSFSYGSSSVPPWLAGGWP